jgi:hypothetical protein
MKELEVQVEEKISEAFENFCREHDTDSQDAIESLIEVYGLAYIYKQKIKDGQLDVDRASSEFDKIIESWLNLAKKRLTALPFPLFLELESHLVEHLESLVKE